MRTAEQPESPIPSNPLGSQPTRRFTPYYGRDELGFIDPARSSELLNVADLLKHPAVLIKAQPWMGKSFFAERMHAWLSSDIEAGSRYGSFRTLTRFEEGISSAQLLPEWWDHWKKLLPGRPAYWIVDGLDECEESHRGVPKQITREIAELPDQSHRSELRLILLSRDRAWLKDFEADLRRAYGNIGWDAPAVLRMAPLDRNEAADMLGSRVTFDKVATTIGQCKDLAGIAGYPRVLTYLGAREDKGPLSAVHVWNAILKDLLEEHNYVKVRSLTTQAEDRFEAVARIGAVITLAGQHHFHSSATESTVPGPALADIFPLKPPAERARHMRAAASESIRIGGPFRTSIEGALRFGHRNIRDWFCAFGLRFLELERLRAFVIDDSGPLPRLVDMLHLLKQVSDHADVRHWLTSILAPLGPASSDAPWGLEEALEQLDHLERIASQSPSNLYIYDPEQLMRLEAPGLGMQLASRLSDATRHSTVRKLLMDIAQAIKAREAVAPALEIVFDSTTQESRLRERALILVRELGTAKDAAQLDGPIARDSAAGVDERSLQAQAILTLVKHGIWTVYQAAQFVPKEHPGVMDTTSLLFYEMEKNVTADDARLIISNQQTLKRPARTHGAHDNAALSYRQNQFRIACIRKLVEEPRLSRNDQVILARLSIQAFADPDEHDLHDLIVKRLRQYAFSRHWLYRHFAEEVKRGNPRPPVYLRRVLTTKDIPWLLKHAEANWKSIQYVWGDLYFLAEYARAHEGAGPRALKGALNAIVRHAPTIPAEFEQAKREFEEQDREIKDRRERKRADAQRRTFTDAVDQLLRQEGLTDIDRLRRLSLVCFSNDPWRYARFEGSWGDLDVDQQRRVLETCQKGLTNGSPTPFTTDNTFTTWHLAEALAFVATLEAWPSTEWTNAAMIEKWLPTVLRTHVPKSLESVTACAARDRAAATTAVIGLIEEEVRKSESHLLFTNYIPADLWPGELAKRVVSLAKDNSVSDAIRAGLLEILAAYDSPSAVALVVEWTENTGGEREMTLLRRKALDVRLALDPEGAWSSFEADYGQRGADALRDASSLWQRRGDFGANLSLWPTPQLVRLAQILLDAFPLPSETEYPPGEWVMMGVDDELKQLRDLVISVLIQRQLDGDTHSIAALFNTEPRLSERLEWEKQQRAASLVLNTLEQTLPPKTPLPASTTIPVEQAVRLLDEADYRLIRSADDLQRALVHVLKQIDESAPYDVSMLYGRNDPAQKGGSSKSNSRKKTLRARLDEAALQAYMRRRLEDILPARIPGIHIKIFPESSVKYRRRFDLDIIAPTIDRQWARIVIEIKWSDNKDIKESLDTQLVRSYLLGHGLSHGIYLVGWNGNWPQHGKNSNTLEGLKSCLEDQVRSITASEKTKHLNVDSVVLDLRWSDDYPEDRGGGHSNGGTGPLPDLGSIGNS